MTKHLSQLELLKTLIRFPTITGDHAANLQAIQWIKDQLAGLPVHTEILTYQDFLTLIVTTRPTKTPKLWLAAHLDVVPGSPESFEPAEQDGKLYGRGAFDMKFAIASYIRLFQELGAALSNYDLGLMITTDEEIGGANGVGALIKEGYRSEAVFLPDGGTNWQFVSAARAVWQLRISATGDTEHGGRPWLGTNAILVLTRFIHELTQLFPAEPCGQNDHFHNSINIGTIQGGKATNQIPDQATATADIRYLEELGVVLKRQIAALIASHPRITLETLAEGSGYQVDRHNPYFQTYVSSLEQAGIAPTFAPTHGSSDARYFNAQGIPAIVLRPAGGGHHSQHEWLDIAAFEQFTTTLKQFVVGTTKTIF